MRRAIRILAIGVLALVLQPYDNASGGGGPLDPGWTRNKSIATSCRKGLLGVGKCQVVRCVGSSCKGESSWNLAEMWDGPASSVVAAFEFAKARVTGTKPNLGQKRKVTVQMD